MIKEITRSFTIAIEDTQTRRVKSFFQVFILADKAFIHSLIGRDVASVLKSDNFKRVIKKYNLKTIEFVMEPATLKLLSNYWDNYEIGKETSLSGKVMNWVTINIE